MAIETMASAQGSKAGDAEVAYYKYYNQDLNIPNSLKLYKDICDQKDSAFYLTCMDIRGMNEIHNVYGREAETKLLYQTVLWLQEHEKKYNYRLYHVKNHHYTLLMRAIRQDGAVESTECTSPSSVVDHDEADASSGLILRAMDQEDAIESSNQVFMRFNDYWEIERVEHTEKIFCRVSMGTVYLHTSPETHLDLLDIIERIEFFAKKENRLIFYDRQKNDEYEYTMKLRHSLKECVLNNMLGFEMLYQPLANTGNLQWVGLEALCRWDSPEIGEVEPEIFIVEAEQMGLIHLLGNWIFEKTISQVKAWKLDEIDLFILFINLSNVQLRDYDMLDKLMVVLDTYEYPPYKLALDIKSAAGCQFDDKMLELLQQIQMNGITLSLEDFEVGRAAFSNIRNLPIYMVKTDRDFISGLEHDYFIQRTLQLMVEYARATGLIVIAEGVETEEQRQIITDKGVNLLQGNCCSKPLGKAQIEDNLYRFHQ
ncbi:MAG: EAL domain-containing protein [Clostridium sp.]|jgi:EAL domain-containing protein (putative c-di-GMP-specific phosphodiesterase class I)|nr:EAL domain-containing protein [Clostridium sp.]